ncbi:TPA: hypothetical protein N0F65_004117 [Lagenidium giganteum]|uniref:Uncharacterized protein n=1 Tax=Lagenidium giganteum TaxID=4803 RepID=A0AAV2ZCI8_9STRA|nr:TPA: hypothetical protein N0F65_004117 [Lagenidium giganteum]
MKDILIGTGLGLIAASFWVQFKNNDLGRINRYYAWYEQQQKTKAVAGGDDDDDE